jgi:hypothetical protein
MRRLVSGLSHGRGGWSASRMKQLEARANREASARSISGVALPLAPQERAQRDRCKQRNTRKSEIILIVFEFDHIFLREIRWILKNWALPPLLPYHAARPSITLRHRWSALRWHLRVPLPIARSHMTLPSSAMRPTPPNLFSTPTGLPRTRRPRSCTVNRIW